MFCFPEKKIFFILLPLLRIMCCTAKRNAGCSQNFELFFKVLWKEKNNPRHPVHRKKMACKEERKEGKRGMLPSFYNPLPPPPPSCIGAIMRYATLPDKAEFEGRRRGGGGGGERGGGGGGGGSIFNPTHRKWITKMLLKNTTTRELQGFFFVRA